MSVAFANSSTRFLIPVDGPQKRTVVGIRQDREFWKRWHTTESFQHTHHQLNGVSTDDGNERWYKVVVEA